MRGPLPTQQHSLILSVIFYFYPRASWQGRAEHHPGTSCFLMLVYALIYKSRWLGRRVCAMDLSSFSALSVEDQQQALDDCVVGARRQADHKIAQVQRRTEIWQRPRSEQPLPVYKMRQGGRIVCKPRTRSPGAATPHLKPTRSRIRKHPSRNEQRLPDRQVRSMPVI